MDKHRLDHAMILTDDAVAELLAKEANEASIRYSSMGLEAFKSTKPLNKAKPNTRFLGRIIKETTSHNAALLAKEAAEAQARLDNLTEAEEKKRRKLNPSASDIRRRQLGAISSILEGRKRSNKIEPTDTPSRGAGRSRDRPRDRSRERSSRRRRREGDRQDKQEPRSQRKRDDEAAEKHRHRLSRSRSPRYRERRRRDRSPLSNDEEDHRLRHSESRRMNSKKDQDLMESQPSRHKDYGRLQEDDKAFSSRSKAAEFSDGGESDPLEEFIGPVPPSRSPVRTRGRGAIRGSATLDSRFAEDYDPASDVQLEPAESRDWDEALEAYRDRQKWKQQGAERLRAAGFTEEQIKKWEKGSEKDIDGVRWSKAGEKREWDRGKEDNEP
ncbi:hypothetical protein C8A03DRAFT_40615 [Achaetomium macrosporum]|uniref:Pre-mRNA-splicing factor 38B n=1 Tax=Achaetomium macrosporum TaxID=79813 RepID=A0AAN7CH80_9PEZI|nr:hypothetical protein C8A03DRAFT_40615 [Achaetomium macrosporum]